MAADTQTVTVTLDAVADGDLVDRVLHGVLDGLTLNWRVSDLLAPLDKFEYEDLTKDLRASIARALDDTEIDIDVNVETTVTAT